MSNTEKHFSNKFPNETETGFCMHVDWASHSLMINSAPKLDLTVKNQTEYRIGGNILCLDIGAEAECNVKSHHMSDSQ